MVWLMLVVFGLTGASGAPAEQPAPSAQASVEDGAARGLALGSSSSSPSALSSSGPEERRRLTGVTEYEQVTTGVCDPGKLVTTAEECQEALEYLGISCM